MRIINRAGRDLELGEGQFLFARWLLRRIPAEHRQDLADRYPAAAIVMWAEQERDLTVARIRERWDVSRATAYRWLAILAPHPASTGDRRPIAAPGADLFPGARPQ